MSFTATLFRNQQSPQEVADAYNSLRWIVPTLVAIVIVAIVIVGIYIYFFLLKGKGHIPGNPFGGKYLCNGQKTESMQNIIIVDLTD